MFRPNRIGTPYIHQDSWGNYSAAFTVAANVANSNTFQANIINVTPKGDFGNDRINWVTGATPFTIPSQNRWAVGQSFAITPPVQGDAVGLELCGTLYFEGTDGMTLQPWIAKLAGPAASVLAPVTMAELPDYIGPPEILADTTTGVTLGRACNYRTQVVVQGSPTYLSGTWGHGVMVHNGDSNKSAYWMQAQFAVRQLNDQQHIGYRDTRR